MRSKQSQKNLPVTARSLETLIRLASAHAKARLSHDVEDCDVEVAVELMSFVLFHEIGDVSAGVGPGGGADSRGNLMNDVGRGKKSKGVFPLQGNEERGSGEYKGGDNDDDYEEGRSEYGEGEGRGKKQRKDDGSSSSSASASSNLEDYEEYANEGYEEEMKENKEREKNFLQEIIRYSQDEDTDSFLVDDNFIRHLQSIPSVFLSLGRPVLADLIKMLRNIDQQNKVSIIYFCSWSFFTFDHFLCIVMYQTITSNLSFQSNGILKSANIDSETDSVVLLSA